VEHFDQTPEHRNCSKPIGQNDSKENIEPSAMVKTPQDKKQGIIY
jgi:hypothetical protein